MITCAPILKASTICNVKALKLTGPFNPTFMTDVVKVNKLLVVIICPTPGWVYIKSKHGIASNGCRNYRIIFDQFLEPGNMDHLAGNASCRLQNLEWSGDTQT